MKNIKIICSIVLLYIACSAVAANKELKNESDLLRCIQYENLINDDLKTTFNQILQKNPVKSQNTIEAEKILSKHLNSNSLRPYYLKAATKLYSEEKNFQELRDCSKKRKEIFNSLTKTIPTLDIFKEVNPFFKAFDELKKLDLKS